MTGDTTKLQISWAIPCNFTRTVTPLSVMRSCRWDRKTCLWIPRETGEIYHRRRVAAPRYIEARLSKFALDVVFNPKTTEWQYSYDGRNKEPVTLPAKFPLLLVQGAEGIAVGLSSKILPHNLNEICDAAIQYLHGEDFQLYPDFPTGGSIDVSKYNDG